MTGRKAVGSMVLALALCLPAAITSAEGDSNILTGRPVVRVGGGQYDPPKPGGWARRRLTPEYKAVWDANIAGEPAGSQEYNRRRAACRAACRG
jgi:hypothetical protein